MSQRRPRQLTGKMAEFASTKRGGGVVLPKLKKVMLDSMHEPDDRRTDIIHPSEMAKADWCPRATYFRIISGIEPEESFNYVRENIFDEGDYIHVKWQDRMRKTGELWGTWRCRICNATEIGLEPSLVGCRYACGHFWLYKEVSLSAEASHMIAGHEDGALVKDNTLVEVKSVGLGTVRIDAPKLVKEHMVKTTDGKFICDLDSLWRDLKRPFTSHVRQAMIYLWMAQQMGLPYKTVTFIYEFKPNQQVKEFVVTLNEKVLVPLLEAARGIKYAVESGEPPECPFGGCTQCEEAERAKDGQANPEQHHVTDEPGQPGSGQEAGEAGHLARTVVRKARRGTTRDPQGPARVIRPRADEPVPGVQPVVPVPGTPARSGPGRRTIRRRQG